MWLALAVILLAAKIGGEIALRLKQPPVLGELLAGVVLGNLGIVGIHAFDDVAHLHAVEALAELGVVLLLFDVGLESTLREMRKVAPTSGLVAVVGVALPMLFGYGVSAALLPNASSTVHLFVGATLSATSVGITARVLADLHATARPETRVILGAAVLDDVLGLIVLAVVTAIAAHGSLPSAGTLTRIVGLAAGFLVGACLVGIYVMPGVYVVASHLRGNGVLGAISMGFCLLLAGTSEAAGLAPIVGAYAAGIILDDVTVRPFGKATTEDLRNFVSPIVAIFAPVFFVRTGMSVQLASVTGGALSLGLALALVGLVGKVVAGFAVRTKGVDRLTVGLGMMPRGEVGLIFADQGARIVLGGKPLLPPQVYVAIVLMVLLTTVVTPPLLSARLRALTKG